MSDEPRPFNEPPYQADVFYSTFAPIDCAKLAEAINRLEPEAPERWEVTPGELKDDGGALNIQTLTLHCGKQSAGLLHHSVPSPATDLLRTTCLGTREVEKLEAHRAFTMIMLMAPDEVDGLERIISLWKIGMALCEQGGIGVHLMHNGLAWPAELLTALIKQLQAMGAEDDLGAWGFLRKHAMPHQLLFNIGLAQGSDGKNYAISRGFAAVGMPDLMQEVGARPDMDQISQFFMNYFDYCMDHGAVIEPGHTMGSDARVAARFSAPPDVEFAFPTYEMLMVTQSRKKFLGIF